jgi:hypothetical protein
MSAHPLTVALAEAAAGAGLSLGASERLTMSVYAVNDEAYGSQNVLISDARGFRAVFKRSRDPECAERLIERMRQLNRRLDQRPYAALREQIVRAFPLHVSTPRGGQTWLMSPYADGRSAYVRIRGDARQREVVRCYERALEFAAVLHAASTSTVTLGALVDEARGWVDRSDLGSAPTIRDPHPGDADIPIAVGIAHLDLVPDNLIVTRRGDLWVDWEYWDETATVFNSVDAILSFGSLAGLSPWERRSETDELRALDPPKTRPWNALTRLTEAHLQRVAPRLRDPGSVGALLDAYFAAKATAQSRTYGRSYGFSRRKLADWRRVRETPEAADAFCRRWPS